VIRPLYHSKNLYLHADLPDEDPHIYCDQTRIREVIVNLLSNAGRFTDSGGVTLQGRISNGRLLISVTDTGPGISADNLKRLFEPFQQLDGSIRRKHGGSGLGLAISKRFVEMHSGEMWVESVVDQGTAVWFSLPVEPDIEVVIPGSTRWVNPAAIVEKRWRPFKAQLGDPLPRFVVMEEGKMVCKLLERYMDDIEVTPVHTLDEAVAVLSESPAQLLVINHPRAEELLHSIGSQARLPFGLPVMAFWLPGGHDFADSLGAARYLVKPVSQEMLLEAVKSTGKVRKVLLVDDNPEILQLYGRILSGSPGKYRVLRASNGQQGLDLLRQHKPDVMILDLIMPEMNGFQVLQVKQADPALSAIPVVLITAQDPSGLPRVSEVVTLTREGGFSVRSLLDLAHSIGVHGEGGGVG
jgi:CheY-like chemotaxis protein